MGDINNMRLKDFYGVLDFFNNRQKRKTGKPVELKQSQKDMIKRVRENDK